MNPRALRAAAVTTVPAALVAALLVATPATAGAPAKADLRVTKATVDKTTVVEGAKLTVTHVVQNRGSRKAGATTTRVYLTTDVAASLAARRASRTNPRSAPIDLRLLGKAAVKPILPGAKRSIAAVKFTVPAGIPAGDYKVLVCADDYGTVAESEEANNCLAATKDVEITEAPGSDDLSVQTFGDTYRWPDDEDDALTYVKIFCNSAYPVKRFTLAGAITSARKFLEQQAPGGLAALKNSGQANTPEKAQELAATALAAGSPGLALAALLEAHRLQPRRGTHLVNAAALATSVGLPNEAIAFLDSSVGRDFLRTPLGIPHEATAAVIRGQALVMTGRNDAAQKLFVSAKQLAPLLSEADAGLATVAACKGQEALAKRYIRRSRQRSDEEVPKTPPTEDPVRPEPNVDVTRGKAMPLRQLPVAETPAQGVVLNDVYKGIQDGFLDEIDARNTEESALDQHLRDTDDLRTAAEIDRRDSILSLIYLSHEEGAVDSASAAYEDALDDLTEMREAFFGGGTGEAPYTYNDLAEAAWTACEGSDDPDCWIKEMNSTCRPELTSAHIAYRTKLLQAQSLGETYLTAWSKRMSGLAANLIDEEAHRLALISIEGSEMGIYAGIVQQAQAWTHYENLFREECVDPLPAEVLDPPPAVGAESPGNCDGALKAMNLRATLGPSTVKVSCERIEQGFSVNVLPLLDVFVDVKFDFRTGNVSVWAGSKGGGTVGGVVEAGFKSGIYVKVNQQGELVDTGWRVGPSVSVGAGAAEFSAWENEIDLSFTSSLTPGY